MDSTDLTVGELFDGLVDLRSTVGIPGANGTANEQVFTASTAICSSSEQCAAGAICNTFARCVVGDPHGANLRDWTQFLPTGSWQTVVSSICVGVADNSFPFDGGYHSD